MSRTAQHIDGSMGCEPFGWLSLRRHPCLCILHATHTHTHLLETNKHTHTQRYSLWYSICSYKYSHNHIHRCKDQLLDILHSSVISLPSFECLPPKKRRTFRVVSSSSESRRHRMAPWRLPAAKPFSCRLFRGAASRRHSHRRQTLWCP